MLHWKHVEGWTFDALRYMEFAFAAILFVGLCGVLAGVLYAALVSLYSGDSAWARRVLASARAWLRLLATAWPVVVFLLIPLFLRHIILVMARITKVGSTELQPPLTEGASGVAPLPRPGGEVASK